MSSAHRHRGGGAPACGVRTPHALLRGLAAALLLAVAALAQEPGPDPETRERRAHFRRLYNEGNDLYHGKHDAVAGMALFEQLEREARAANDPEWRKSGLWKMGQVHAGAGRREVAVELFEEAREIIFAEPGPGGTANHFLVLGNLCKNYEALGRMGMVSIRHAEAADQARRYFARYLKLPENNDPFAHTDADVAMLNNLGFIGQVLAHESRQRFASGREDAGILVAEQLERVLSVAPFQNHWERDLRDRTRLRLAEWNDEIGRPGERDRWETLLLVAEGQPGHGRAEWHLARLRRAARLHAAGEDRAARRAEAEESLARLKATNQTAAWFENQVVLARMSADEGDGDAGLAVLDAALLAIAELQEPYARARLLLARAELRCDLGRGGDAATLRDLREALAWFRSVGGLREEPRAYLVYARHLRQSGKPAEARAALADAGSRLRRFRSPALGRSLAEEWGAALAEARRAAPETGTGAGRPAFARPGDAPPLGDLQPVEVATRVAPGDRAGARFTVTHAGSAPVEGVLHAVGAIREASWDERALAWRLTVDAAGPAREVRQPVRLESLDQARVILRRDAAAPDSPAVEVGWTAEGRRQTAWWRFAPAPDASRPVLRNDNLALADPFYAVPLHHRPDDAARATGGFAALRARADSPCRIEIADERTGEVLAVDAQGDGDFRGAGDVLWRDADNDGHPELRLDPAEESGLELYVYPAVPGADVQIALEARGPDGVWRAQTIDTLLGSAR